MAQHMLKPVEFRGFTVFCTAYATDREGSVYFSLIGRVTALQAVWAAFHSDYGLLDGMIRKRPAIEGAKYHTVKARLPDSGWGHYIVVHTQATEQNLADEDFYLLFDTSEAPLDAFWSRWNRALPLPARQEWAERMWEQGKAQGLIRQVQAEGTVCWKVLANREKWSTIITNLAKGEI